MAIKDKAKTYFTGKPCTRGHIAPRYVSTRSCVKCADIRAREYQARHRRRYLDGQNRTRIFRLFGLTEDAYATMLASQNGGCAICGKTNASGHKLAVDHDHKCCPTDHTCGKCIRGLLCDHCNHGLGKFGDDPALLEVAANYLRTRNGR